MGLDNERSPATEMVGLLARSESQYFDSSELTRQPSDSGFRCPIPDRRLKRAETKVYAKLSHMDKEYEDTNDDEDSARDVAVNVTVALDGDGGATQIASPAVDGFEPDDTGLEQLELLRQRQQEQMQTLLARQSEIAEQQMALLAQQEAQRDNQRAIELERARLQSLQQEQLAQTEIVLEQQRHYLDDRQLHAAEGCGEIVRCGVTPPKGPKTAREQSSGSLIFGSSVDCFSAEI